MAINEILWMTKPKLALLGVFLIALIPKYYNSNCLTGSCPSDAVITACQCGFSLPNFFTLFVMTYVGACVIIEMFNYLRK
ncbi:MAG: hypothetical protein WCI04_07430 [archaeon]